MHAQGWAGAVQRAQGQAERGRRQRLACRDRRHELSRSQGHIQGPPAQAEAELRAIRAVLDLSRAAADTRVRHRAEAAMLAVAAVAVVAGM